MLYCITFSLLRELLIIGLSATIKLVHFLKNFRTNIQHNIICKLLTKMYYAFYNVQ